ncbi:MAG: ABC transporter ATP-binding protein [Deltaproteobacteria bacterium]|nr:ABC transporter ATP-binding protein [Deltaproteobacteria bacterium]
MLLINGLHCACSGKKILFDIAFELKPGDFLSVIGANGAGKTTLLKCLAGIRKAQKGDICFAGVNQESVSQRIWARSVALLPQQFSATQGMLVEDLVLLGRIPFARGFFEGEGDYRVVRASLQAVGMEGFARRFLSTLSGGELQRVLIAKSLAQQPQLLLLDEPTSSLDIKHQREIIGMLKKIALQDGMTIIAAMHDINAAIAISDRMLLLKEGRMLNFGTPQAVISSATLEALYDTPLAVREEKGRLVVLSS